MNAELASIKQSKHTHYFEQRLISVVMNSHNGKKWLTFLILGFFLGHTILALHAI
jgi:hypothetical protein